MIEGTEMEGIGLVGEVLEWTPAGLGLGLGLLLIRFLAMVIAQWNVKEDRIDKSTQTLIAQQQQQIKDLLEWKSEVVEALKECQERHAASELEVARLSGILQGYGDARNLAQMNAAADKAAEKRGNGK